MKIFWLLLGHATRWLADKSAAVSEFSLDRYDAINRGERRF